MMAPLTMVPRLSRVLLVLAALMTLALGPAARPAAAAETPEAFVQALADQAVTILKDKNTEAQQRYGDFRTLLLANADLERIARFVLGRYASELRASGRYEEYLGLFREYVVRIYAARLGQYSGEKLSVLKTLNRSGGEVVVYTMIEPGPSGGDPIAVNWRLNAQGEGFKIMDVQIAGAWMAIEQRDQFTSIIVGNGRDPVRLIDFLKQQLKNRPPSS